MHVFLNSKVILCQCWFIILRSNIADFFNYFQKIRKNFLNDLATFILLNRDVFWYRASKHTKDDLEFALRVNIIECFCIFIKKSIFGFVLNHYIVNLL